MFIEDKFLGFLSVPYIYNLALPFGFIGTLG
jgi:hypothetical protein